MGRSITNTIGRVARTLGIRGLILTARAYLGAHTHLTRGLSPFPLSAAALYFHLIARVAMSPSGSGARAESVKPDQQAPHRLSGPETVCSAVQSLGQIATAGYGGRV
jgi:hypothetical protein